jgi:polyphosphate kinase 2 (PPK2 family)
MNIPQSGHIIIFDRSWYGRVLVERINEAIQKIMVFNRSQTTSEKRFEIPYED